MTLPVAPRLKERRRPATQPVCVLLVEDSAADGRLVVEVLRETGSSWRVERVERVVDAEQYLRRHRVDCVLLDLSVLDADGLDGLRRLVGADAELPVVVLTRRDDEVLPGEALRHGAQDYLSKRELEPRMLDRALRYAIERKATERQLLRMAHQDALTGVVKRELLLERLAAALDPGPGASVLFADVDDLKHVNDALGHDLGDQVLVAVAHRMLEVLRPSDLVGRFGGDEFAVVCPGLVDPVRALELAARVRDGVAQPLVLGTRVYVPSVSVGVAVCEPGTGLRAAAALGNADVALLRAKRLGKSRVELYQDTMRHARHSHIDLLTQLRTAHVEDQFEVHYQPEVVLATGEVVGVEALLRWRHPTRGMLVASEFVEVLEDSDMIGPLGLWVLEQACSTLASWCGPRGLRMAVNVSPHQVSLPGFAAQAREVLQRYGVDPELLELEVTESALLVADVSSHVLRELRDEHVRLAVDDFGTGFSSLNHLKLFPASTVKIDRSFVAGLGQDPVDEAIVAAVLAVAGSLGLSTVAEGIETEGQRRRLLELGCEIGQGYLFSHAQPVGGLALSYA